MISWKTNNDINVIGDPNAIKGDTLKFLAGDASNRKYFTLKKNNSEDLLIMFDENKESFSNFVKI